MARENIYIRKHNEKKWAQIKNKSEWVNKMLEQIAGENN